MKALSLIFLFSQINLILLTVIQQSIGCGLQMYFLLCVSCFLQAWATNQEVYWSLYSIIKGNLVRWLLGWQQQQQQQSVQSKYYYSSEKYIWHAMAKSTESYSQIVKLMWPHLAMREQLEYVSGHLLTVFNTDYFNAVYLYSPSKKNKNKK